MVTITSRSLRSLALLLVVLSAAAWAGLRPVWSLHYVRERLVWGPWGEEAGAFGRTVAADGSWWGPQAFAIAGRAIAVIDSVNHRLQVFNPRGQLTQTIPLALPGGTRFSAGDVSFYRGRWMVWDAGSHRVLQWDAGEWRVAAESPLPPGPGTVVPEGLADDDSGHLYYAATLVTDTHAAWKLWRFSPGIPAELVTAVVAQPETLSAGVGIVQLAPELPGLVLGFALSPGGRLHLHVAGDARGSGSILTFCLASGRRVSVMDPGRSVPFPSRLAGADGNARFYLVDAGPSRPSSLVVLDARGEALAAFALGHGTVRGMARVRVDERGNLYVMDHDEEGMSVTRHAPRRALKLVPRWRRP